MRNHESLKHRGKNFNKHQKTEKKMAASWKCFITYEICSSIVNSFKKKNMLQKNRLQDVLKMSSVDEDERRLHQDEYLLRKFF